MKCSDPILCYRKAAGGAQYRNFSLASPVFKIAAQKIFDCGKCLHCRKKKARELAMRCVLHASLSSQNCFLTLTYDEKNPEYHNELSYNDIQAFKKRLRRHCQYHHDKKTQIFNVHEYGKNGKKHWHLVVFNHQFEDRRVLFTKNGNTLYTSELLTTLWPHGIHTIGDVSEASAMYTAQYTQKDFQNNNLTNGRKSHSKHSGIGRDYFLIHYEQILKLGYVPFSGQKLPIPRYFYKLAHKHYSHFYATENFFDTKQRKKLYSKFKAGQENRHIADLFVQYDKTRQENILIREQEWRDSLQPYSKAKTDFQQAGENAFYDLQNKIQQGEF